MDKQFHLSDVIITHLSQEGDGLATVELHGKKRAIEIPGTFAGETVSVCCHKGKRKKLFGKLTQVQVASPLRVQASCVHYNSCGGCKMQHMRYEEELKYKEVWVHSLFSPWKEDAIYYPIVSSPQVWHYRNKMEFSFSQDKAGEKFLGLMLARSRGKVFHLEECPLAPDWMVEGLKLCRGFWQASDLLAYNYRKNTGHLRNLTFRESPRSGDRMCILTVSGNPDFVIPKADLQRFVHAMQQIAPSQGGKLSIILRIHQIHKGMKTEIYEMKLVGDDYIREIVQVQGRDVELYVSPQAFCQPNTQAASLLYERAIELAKLHTEDVVYDLYCGIGSFGLVCAPSVKHVVGIELSHDSAYDAKENAKRLGIENYTILRGDVGELLKEHKELPKPHVVFVDPPRAGLDTKAMQEVLFLKPEKIIYISCNPVTQAANIADFVAAGYHLVAIQPVDQFPHTAHVENIALLQHSTHSVQESK